MGSHKCRLRTAAPDSRAAFVGSHTLPWFRRNGRQSVGSHTLPWFSLNGRQSVGSHTMSWFRLNGRQSVGSHAMSWFRLNGRQTVGSHALPWFRLNGRQSVGSHAMSWFRLNGRQTMGSHTLRRIRARRLWNPTTALVEANICRFFPDAAKSWKSAKYNPREIISRCAAAIRGIPQMPPENRCAGFARRVRGIPHSALVPP